MAQVIPLKAVRVNGDITALGEFQEGDTLPASVLPSGTQRVFVQPAAPTVEAGMPYVWFQTGLGAGNDMTLWVEDGQ